MSKEQLLEDIARSYLGSVIQGVHLKNYTLHNLAYNHGRDIEKKLGLPPAGLESPPPDPETDPMQSNERMGISPFPASMRSTSTTKSESTTSKTEPAKKSSAPVVGAAIGALLLGTAGGAIGAKLLGGADPSAVVQPAEPSAVPAPTTVTEYEQLTGQVELEVR